jgi:hypothetical protein
VVLRGAISVRLDDGRESASPNLSDRESQSSGRIGRIGVNDTLEASRRFVARHE